jgi:hypothetical protein
MAHRPRDPRRSLLIGSLIAGVVLLAVLMLIAAGLVLAFRKRTSDPEGLGRTAVVLRIAGR